MRVLNWKIGAVGAYLDPANWVEGVAPGPGDTANIPGGSGPEFYPPDVDPDFLSNLGEPAPPGDTIASETINFTPVASTNVLPQLSNTTFAANTALNVAGPGTQNIQDLQAAQDQSGSLPDGRADQARQRLAQQTDRRAHALGLGCRTLIVSRGEQNRPVKHGHGSSLTLKKSAAG